MIKLEEMNYPVITNDEIMLIRLSLLQNKLGSKNKEFSSILIIAIIKQVSY